MQNQLSIKIGNDEFLADLLVGDAPKTIKAMLAVLPMPSKCWHAAWWGDAIVQHEAPKEKMPYIEPENSVVFCSRGEVLWYPGQPDLGYPYGGGELIIAHGATELKWRGGYTPANLFARINHNLDDLDDIGQEMWAGGGAKDLLISLADSYTPERKPRWTGPRC